MAVTAEPNIEHVTVAANLCGGRPCVAGTRVRVWDVASIVQAGGSVDDVLAAYPRLSLADVHGALAYFYDHREAIERQAAADVAVAARLREQFGPGPLERSEASAGASGR